MKTNFDSKLFEKQINLDSCNSILGGRMATGCTNTVYSYENGSKADETSTHYDEQGNITSIDHCYD